MDKVEKARAAVKSGDLEKAHKMVRWLLKNEPSADAWVLASELAATTDEKIKYLREALKLDAWHNEANRLLYKIEGSKPQNPIRDAAWDRKAGEKPVTEIKRQLKKDRYEQQDKRQGRYTRYGCILSLLFSIFFSMSVFRAAGLMTAEFSAKLASFFSQPAPAAQINSTPIALIDKPQLILTPSRVEAASAQDVEILDAGYVHDHTFTTRSGGEYAIYVQFISATAKRVRRNISIVDPNGGEAGQRCDSQPILTDDTNAAFICMIDVPGSWHVLIMGRDQESVGAYFVGVQKLD
jgi:hypothetical protein